MQNTVNWTSHRRVLKDRFRVLLYDARTQGQSDLGDRKISLQVHAEDLAALLKHLEVETAYLVGLSHGASVAVAYAESFPQSVGRLVLCSVGAQPTCRVRLVVKSWLKILKSSGLEAMAWASLPVVFGESFLKQKEKSLHTIVKGIVTRNKKQSLVAQLEAMISYPRLSQIAGNLRIPCLVISGSDDPLTTEQGAEQLAALCGGRQEKITGIGHSVPIEAPGWFNQTVLNFLC